MTKDPRFFTPEVDDSMNIINECDKEEHSRMRRMLSFAFSMSNLMRHEDVLIRRTDEFLDAVGGIESENGKKGMNNVKKFNYVTFNIMGEISFGDSWDLRLKEQSGQSSFSTRPQTFRLTFFGEHRYHWADVILHLTFFTRSPLSLTFFSACYTRRQKG